MPVSGEEHCDRVKGLEVVLENLKRILPAFAEPGQVDGFQRTLEEASEAILAQVCAGGPFYYSFPGFVSGRQRVLCVVMGA